MSSSSNSTFNHNTSLIAGIVVGIIVLSLVTRLFIMHRRRSRANPPTMIPQRQQFPMNPRLNIPRQPSRDGWAPRLYQPSSDTTLVRPPSRPNARRSPLNPAVTEQPLPPLTPPPEPQPIYYTPEHGQPDTITLDLVQRMRKVQTMMAEIQRLENESRSGIDHRQRIQELQQQVIELSDTTPTTTDARPVSSHIPPTSLPGSVGASEPPPAYVR